MPVSDYESQTDRELAIGAANGDQRAFAALYDRLYPGVYDFARRTLGDSNAAAEVSQVTFAGAWRALSARRVPEHVKGWLFSFARDAALARPAKQGAPAAAPPPQAPAMQPSFIELDPARMPAAQAAPDQEVRAVVWQTAVQMGRGDYSLLDMHLRRDLAPAEMAEGMRVSAETADATLSDLVTALDQATLTTLLLRHGRESCPDLEALLSQSTEPEISPAVREAVLAHVDSCANCQATRSRFLPASQIFPAFALIAAPGGLQELTWGNIMAAPRPAAPVTPAPVAAAPPEKKRRYGSGSFSVPPRPR